MPRKPTKPDGPAQSKRFIETAEKASVGWAKRSVPTADSPSLLTVTWARRCAPLPTLRLLVDLQTRRGRHVPQGQCKIFSALRRGVFFPLQQPYQCGYLRRGDRRVLI